MSDGQREQQAPKLARGDGAKNRSKSGSQLLLPTMIGSSPLMTAAVITRKILGTPLVTSKDAPYPTDEDYATGGCEEKWARIEGLVSGLTSFIEPKGNLHKEIVRYTACLVKAVSAFKKTNKSLGPAPPSTADKAVCTPPIFSVGATSKRPAMSPPAPHATHKRRAATAAFRQIDENNNNVVDQDQDGFVLVDHRRHRHRNQPATTVGSARPRQQPKPRPAQRRVHHRPDAIVIRAKDATTYADILRTLKVDAALQRSVSSSVQNIRRSAAGALVLQLRKGVENAPSLGAEVDKVLGDVATPSAIQHPSMVEIRDLNECATRTGLAEELARSLGAPHLNEEVIKTLRKAYAGTQSAVAALSDDLAARALKLGHIRIGWVNCRIRGREEATRCYRCWSPGHVAARCRGPNRTELCHRCGQKGHQANDCKGQPACVLCQERRADDHRHTSMSSSCPLTRKITQARR
uniref:CCHC-type domain-containing protein n=1 Tax=Trichogramma kaykai TaxID=54128 RepID=A0ABD2WB41_9HYME